MQRKEGVIMNAHNDEYMSIIEACNVIGVSRRTLERYVDQGLIKRYTRGIRNVTFKREDVEELKRFLEEPKEDK